MPGFCSTLAASRSKSKAVSPYKVGIARIAVAMVLFLSFFYFTKPLLVMPQQVNIGGSSKVFRFIFRLVLFITLSFGLLLSVCLV